MDIKQNTLRYEKALRYLAKAALCGIANIILYILIRPEYPFLSLAVLAVIFGVSVSGILQITYFIREVLEL